MCGVMDAKAAGGYGNVSLECAGEGATISSIDFAAFGTPYGTCGEYHHNASCDAANATAVAEALCLGQASCSVPSYPALGDPCFDVYKTLIVQGRCSDGEGPSTLWLPRRAVWNPRALCWFDRRRGPRRC